jgi:hypothetical protein
MKRIVVTALLMASMTGCLATRPKQPPDPNGELAAESKLAEKLPLVTPDAITAENHRTKVEQFQKEMLLESRRLDSTSRNVASAVK